MKTSILSVMLPFFFFCGCMNMPSTESKILPAYVSDLQYKDFKCDELQKELDDLKRREKDLEIAQTNRVKSSQVQAFIWGGGAGDGLEASELANVRGSIVAVKNVMKSKGCQIIEEVELEEVKDLKPRYKRQQVGRQ